MKFKMMGIPNTSFVGFNTPEKYRNFVLADVNHIFGRYANSAFIGFQVFHVPAENSSTGQNRTATAWFTNFSLN